MKIYILMMLFHWIGDFVLQSDWMARNKSKNWKALSIHVLIYSFVMFIFATITQHNINININIILYFSIFTYISHFLTDTITSRINSKLWDDQKVHYFFVSVGFDQLIHFVTLALSAGYFLGLNC